MNSPAAILAVLIEAELRKPENAHIRKQLEDDHKQLGNEKAS